jgi:regulator of RNase E activity RraA
MYSLQVREPARRVDAATVAKFRDIPVANISDVMARITAGGPRLRPLHSGGVLAGPAYTVKTRPGDNLFIHKALDMAMPGDVLVVDAGGDLTNSLVGEMMLTYAEKRGLAGMVLNGAVRDLGHIKSHSFPVFAAGVTHRGPYKSGPGEINVAIALDGMVIEPGDLIIGDDDGLLCVPFDLAEAILKEAGEKHESENRQMEAILAGTNDRKWVDVALSKIDFKVARS